MKNDIIKSWKLDLLSLGLFIVDEDKFNLILQSRIKYLYNRFSLKLFNILNSKNAIVWPYFYLTEVNL